MNICFLGHYTAGGTERATFLVANELNKKHKIFVINTCDRKPYFKLDGITMDYLQGGSMFNRVVFLTMYLKQNKIDVLITVESLTGVISILAAKFAHCKHIVWEHANYYQNQGSKYIQKIRQLELKIADAYVVLTERDLNNFKNNFRIHHRCKLEYIYNIADEKKLNVYDVNSKTIMSAGHIRKIKNFIIIPDIAKLVFEKHPDWCWKIYGGENGEQYPELKQKIENYGLEKNVLLCGRCNDMDKAYQEASMYVMTSLQEGLPMVLLEAKSNGLPLISFDIETGPSEIIKDGINGYLVQSYDVETMAAKINELIENPKLRKFMSDSSSIDLQKFDKKAVVGSWINLIEESR